MGKRYRTRHKSSKRKVQLLKSVDNSAIQTNFNYLHQQLRSMKLTLREIPGDGNCLFGALADQIDGTPKAHMKYRQDVVDYMRSHREHFEPFVEDEESFEDHLSQLSESGNFGGNECIVAFAQLHQVKVVIHQLNTPLWQIDGSDGNANVREVHISYHNGDHYNSVRRVGESFCSIPNIKIKSLLESKEMTEASTDVPSTNNQSKNAPFSTKDDRLILEENRDAANHIEGNERSISQTEREDQDTNQTTEMTENCEIVMERTGCDNLPLIQKFLIANNNDVDGAIDDVLNFIVHRKGHNLYDTENSTSPNTSYYNCQSEFSETSNELSVGASKQDALTLLREKLKCKSLSAAERNEIKKQIRKRQSCERKIAKSKRKNDQFLSNEYRNNRNNDIVGEFTFLSI